MLNIFSSSRYKIERRTIKNFIRSLYTKYEIGGDLTLNIIFVGKIKMRSIASTYKHEDVALPVLSFPYKGEKTGEEKLLGEIFICYPQMVLLAAERNKTVRVMLEQLLEHGLTNLLKES